MVLALAWIALIGAVLGRHAWLLDLLAHFRVQYCVVFALVAAAGLWARRPALTVGALLGCLLSGWPVAAYVALPTSSAEGAAEPLRLITLNVWFRNRDHARVASYLAREDADVVVVQEATGPMTARLRELLTSYPHAFVDQTPHGAIVFSKWPVLSAQRAALGEEGSVADVVIDWRGTPVRVLGVHLHWPLGRRNSELRNTELSGLADLARRTSGPLLIAGDFNVTAWSPHFRDLIVHSRMHDCAAGRGLAPSWPSQLGWLGIRIDHCLASPHWSVLSTRIGPHVGSDHRALIAELALDLTSGG